MNKDNMKKYGLPIVLIPVAGFILFNITFMVYALYQMALSRIFSINQADPSGFQMPVIRLSFIVVILVLSWLIFRAKKIPELVKAIYATVPAVVTLLVVGLELFSWPVIAYTVCAAIYAVSILCLILTKRSWMYIYAVTFSALSLLIVIIAGIDI